MGLGKTIQAIAAAEIFARTAGIERVLVVAPRPRSTNGRRKSKSSPAAQAMVVEGSLARARRTLRGRLVFQDSPITTLCIATSRPSAAGQPDLIILDEAQRIKNWNTRTAQSVKQLESEFAFVLTGTPLENRLEELHSIIEFVDRFRLGPMFRFLDAAPARRRSRPRGGL